MFNENCPWNIQRILHFMDKDTVKQLKPDTLLLGQHGMGFVGRVKLKPNLNLSQIFQPHIFSTQIVEK